MNSSSSESSERSHKYDQVKPTEKDKNRVSTKQAWYQAIWRWHFYAGIIFAPFLIILAVSGGVYLFKPQIESVLYKDLLTVSVTAAEQTSKLSPDEMLKTVKQRYSNSAITTFTSITIEDSPHASYKLTALHNGMSVIMYVNPYTGEVLGMMDANKTFTAFFKKMHSELVIGGTIANRLVELAACWGFILIGTGIFLWWPRNKEQVWGIMLPRLSRPSSRRFWRDLHAVPAFWLSLLLLIIIASGLPWSGVTGSNISSLATSTNTNTPPYAYIWDPKPQSVTLAKDIAEDLPWAAEHLPVPESSIRSFSGSYVTLGLDDVMHIAERYEVKQPYSITFPPDSGSVYTISASADNPANHATLHIDQYSGAVLTDVRFADYGIIAKLISYGIAFHEGKLFGLANQLLGLIACVGLILISFSSYVMWLKRKPTNKLGAPAKAKNNTITLGALFILLACGLIMPLVGISIIIVVIADLFLLRRIKSLRTWFSL